MVTEDPIFGLKVSNLPPVNVRSEFESYLALLADDAFLLKLRYVREPIELPLFTWRDLPKNLLTFMLQRSILGVESCVGAAVEYRLALVGRFDDEIAVKLNDPFKLPGLRGTAETFYNNMPALINPKLQLRVKQPDLWIVVSQFYKEVRNNLFHGYQLQQPHPANVLAAMKMLESVYVWMDLWWGAFAPIAEESGVAEEQ
jgi:hypothetical protein